MYAEDRLASIEAQLRELQAARANSAYDDELKDLREEMQQLQALVLDSRGSAAPGEYDPDSPSPVDEVRGLVESLQDSQQRNENRVAELDKLVASFRHHAGEINKRLNQLVENQNSLHQRTAQLESTRTPPGVAEFQKRLEAAEKKLQNVAAEQQRQQSARKQERESNDESDPRDRADDWQDALRSSQHEVAQLKQSIRRVSESVDRLLAQRLDQSLAGYKGRLERVEKQQVELENQHRQTSDRKPPQQWLAPSAAFVAILVALLAWMRSPEAAKPDSTFGPTITAQRFVVDENGKRIEIGMIDGVPSLLLYDERGVRRAAFELGQKGPLLTLAHADGRDSVVLAAEQNGAYLSLKDRAQNERLRVGTGATGDGIAVADSQGGVRIGLGLTERGAALNLFDASQTPRVMLGYAGNEPALALLDAVGQHRATVGVSSRGDAILNLHDSNGKQRAVLDVTTEGPRLKFLNETQKVVQFVPGHVSQ